MKFNTFLLIFVVIVSTVLLIGRSLDAPWAGGEGYATHSKATLNEEPLSRGEIAETTENELKVLKFGSTHIYLSERTQIELVDTREGRETINVIQGRALIDGAMRITTREIETHVNGTTSFIHYSWEDKIEISVVEGQAQIPNAEINLTFGDSISLPTLPPYVPAYTAFNPSQSSEAAFYTWAFEQIKK